MQLKDFIILAGLCVSLTSCIKDHPAPVSSSREASVSLVVRSGSGTQDPEVLGQAETVIRDAWIYAFANNILQNSIYVRDIEAEQFTVKDFKVPVTGSLMVYALINPPSGHGLAQLSNPAAIGELLYGMTEYFPDGWAFGVGAGYGPDAFCLPAFGQTQSPISVARDTALAIVADRAVARVDVLLQRKPGTPTIAIDSRTSLSVRGSREYGYFAPWNIADDTALKSGQNAAFGPSDAVTVPVEGEGALRAFSYYMPERDCRTAKPSFTLGNMLVQSSRMDYEDIVIGGSDLESIDRNKVYRIVCTFSEISANPEVVVVVEDWDEKSAEVIFN